MRAKFPGLDLSVYVRGLVNLVRNPVVIVPPLLMSVICAAIGMMGAGGGVGSGSLGTATGGIISLIEVLLRFFGLGVAIIIGDQTWRRSRASFEDGWAEGRRKTGDILIATLGLTFCLYIAGLVGGFLGPLVFLLVAVVLFFLIYTIPAAAIGGVPGGATLQTSIEAVRFAPLPALVLAIVSVALYFVLEIFVIPELSLAIVPYLTGSLNPLVLVFDSLVESIFEGYLAIVAAKVYADNAFARRW
jgi:hypothetical protein